MRSDPRDGSSPQPQRWSWSWVQFWSAFVVTAFVAFIRIGPHELGVHLSLTFTFALILGCLAGRYGDPVWYWVIGSFRIWR